MQMEPNIMEMRACGKRLQADKGLKINLEYDVSKQIK